MMRPRGAPHEKRVVISPLHDAVSIGGMAVFCPNCGAESHNSAFNCASCGWPLQPSTDAVATLGDGEQERSGYGHVATSLPGERTRAWRSAAKMIFAAEILAAVATVLLVTSFILLVDYYESVMDPDHFFEDMQHLQNVVRAMQYTLVFGELMAIIGLILVVGGLRLTGAAPMVECFRRSNLSGVLGLVVVVATLICVLAVATVLLYEGEGSEDLDRVVARLSLYIRPLVEALVVVLLVMVTDGLRRGVLEAMPDGPRSRMLDGPPP